MAITFLKNDEHGDIFILTDKYLELLQELWATIDWRNEHFDANTPERIKEKIDEEITLNFTKIFYQFLSDLGINATNSPPSILFSAPNATVKDIRINICCKEINLLPQDYQVNLSMQFNLQIHLNYTKQDRMCLAHDFVINKPTDISALPVNFVETLLELTSRLSPEVSLRTDNHRHYYLSPINLASIFLSRLQEIAEIYYTHPQIISQIAELFPKSKSDS